MNQIFKLLFILLAGIFFTNCGNIKNGQNKTLDNKNLAELSKTQIIEFNIENPGETEKITLSELGVADIKYIPLETNDSCLLSRIRKFRTNGKDFVIYPSGGSIMNFTNEGKYVANIGKMGRGPHEYRNIHDFQIEPTSGNIFILSGWEDKFYVYSPTGMFLKNMPVPVNATGFDFINDKILFHCMNIDGQTENSFIVTKLNGDSITAFANKYKYERGKLGIGFSNEYFRFKLDHELLVKEICADTVFSFNGNEFYPKFIVNRGEKRLVPEARICNTPEEMKTKMDPYMFAYNFMISKYFMYYFGHNSMELDFIVGIIENGEINVRGSNEKLVNDIDGGPKLQLETILDDNTVLSWTDAIELKTHVASDEFKNSTPKYPEKKKALEELANSLNENDNPVLMLVKLKE